MLKLHLFHLLWISGEFVVQQDNKTTTNRTNRLQALSIIVLYVCVRAILNPKLQAIRERWREGKYKMKRVEEARARDIL